MLPGAPSYSKTMGFRVVPGKHQCLCWFSQQIDFLNSGNAHPCWQLQSSAIFRLAHLFRLCMPDVCINWSNNSNSFQTWRAPTHSLVKYPLYNSSTDFDGECFVSMAAQHVFYSNLHFFAAKKKGSSF